MYARDTARIATPIGLVEIISDGDVIHSLSIGVDGSTEHEGQAPVLRAAVEQLRDYFAGKRRDFDLPLKAAASPRGQALRDAMTLIPFGETMSYGGLARKAGSAPRAIGQACARNPFPIIVPCHRVLAADGIGHYSGGDGVPTKTWLLDHERRHSGATML